MNKPPHVLYYLIFGDIPRSSSVYELLTIRHMYAMVYDSRILASLCVPLSGVIIHTSIGTGRFNLPRISLEPICI